MTQWPRVLGVWRGQRPGAFILVHCLTFSVERVFWVLFSLMVLCCLKLNVHWSLSWVPYSYTRFFSFSFWVIFFGWGVQAIRSLEWAYWKTRSLSVSVWLNQWPRQLIFVFFQCFDYYKPFGSLWWTERYLPLPSPLAFGGVFCFWMSRGDWVTS